MASLNQMMNDYLEQLLAGWNIYTIALGVLLGVALLYPLIFGKDPDTHPALLARQASPSHIRHEGESATYRCLEVPHSYPLKSGLGVKDPGAPKWTAGRDGDLRDVWKKALEGHEGKKRHIVSIMGKETKEHKLEDLTADIIAVGEHLEEHDAKRVAIYLPNSVEFVVALFACAFYGVTPILVPQKQSFKVLSEILHSTRADVLFAPAGTVPVEHLAMSCPNLKHTIWVVEKSSRHMDFKVTPGTTQTAIEWHELIGLAGPGISELSVLKADFKPPNIIIIDQNSDQSTYNVIEFPQSTLIAATASQLSVLPRNHRFDPSDLVMPIDALTTTYPLVVTLAALYSNTSLALTPAAGSDAGYDSAFPSVSSVAPTIVIASAQTMLLDMKEKTAANIGNTAKIQYALGARALASGHMNNPNTLENKAGPRIIYISTSVGAESTFLTFKQLNDVRLVTGARTIYALTVPNVAGAIAQTSIFDYRLTDYPNQLSHFGAPTSSVEIKLVDTASSKIDDDKDPVGHIIVKGPAVVSGETKIEVMGRIREDQTFALVYPY